MLFQAVRDKPPPLPKCEVGVLDARLGQRRRPSLPEGGVELRELPVKKGLRPAVEGEVMGQDEEDVLVLSGDEESNSQERLGGRREGPQGLASGHASHLGATPCVGESREVDS